MNSRMLSVNDDTKIQFLKIIQEYLCINDLSKICQLNSTIRKELSKYIRKKRNVVEIIYHSDKNCTRDYKKFVKWIEGCPIYTAALVINVAPKNFIRYMKNSLRIYIEGLTNLRIKILCNNSLCLESCWRIYSNNSDEIRTEIFHDDEFSRIKLETYLKQYEHRRKITEYGESYGTKDMHIYAFKFTDKQKKE